MFVLLTSRNIVVIQVTLHTVFVIPVLSRPCMFCRAVFGGCMKLADMPISITSEKPLRRYYNAQNVAYGMPV